ncbi:MAG: hypothetical protein IBX72_03165 [Nitrospirae bacterium]|jgi:hypothetical protein|nr:hypothetical protein [Nitrospirota bacterium]
MTESDMNVALLMTALVINRYKKRMNHLSTYNVKLGYLTSNLKKRDQATYNQAIQYLEDIFKNHGQKLQEVKELAWKIKEGFEKISPLIQKFTGEICPTCKDVCCINKHGFYNFEDLIYLHSLGLSPPDYKFQGDELDPCQFLSSRGCILERQFRPSGCNWYFCDPLLEHMEKIPEYEEFDGSLTALAELWIELIDQFSNAIMKID